ncbi:MAG TPA: ATP phosphoribosyltransferase regulatory subunit [Sandaracinaceae bacterium LLY-WYZ-13_1]|nr:ATP phosphoribosyltransferase regulatory subunit [Sandaracinaceae bacterium LLY-WYZ-13_1]
MSFPLAPPAGMRDLLPPEAAARAQLASGLTRLFSTWGYELVTTPPFEHAEVIERGLDTLDRRDLLRFVEPDTGEVALLRPDITPQIARIVATQLADRPAPWRLCYAGSLIRQRRGRARKQRQIAQAGVELVGLEGASGDAEVIALAARALESLQLTDYRIELSLVSLPRAALAELPQGAREAAEEALTRKDGAALEAALKHADRETRRRLLGAAELYGEVDLLTEARRIFRSKAAQQSLRGLARVIERVEARGLGPRLALDLGEVRGASYYSGVSFALLAHGPGEPVGAGGRYDGLLERFGAPAAATGFGLDLSNLEWALADVGRRPSARRQARFVVAGGKAADRERVAEELRRAEVGAAVIPARGERAALDYARAWGYDAAVLLGRGGPRALRASDGARRSWRRPGALVAWARPGDNDGSEG